MKPRMRTTHPITAPTTTPAIVVPLSDTTDEPVSTSKPVEDLHPDRVEPERDATPVYP